MQQLAATSKLDFHSDTYKDAYSRINAIVIEGEQEAHENYIRLGELLPEHKDEASAEGRVVTCLLIQSLIIECFAIAAYNIYIPVADDFARKITEGVVKDEYSHLNFGEAWLKDHFEESKAELEQANRQNLPIVWRMLNSVEADAHTLAMEKDALVEDFMIQYGEALANIGFTTRDIMRLSAYGLTGA